MMRGGGLSASTVLQSRAPNSALATTASPKEQAEARALAADARLPHVDLVGLERDHRLLEPDEVTYTLAIHAAGKQGKAERALMLLDEMKQRSLTPTEVTYNAAIYACSEWACCSFFFLR